MYHGQEILRNTTQILSVSPDGDICLSSPFKIAITQKKSFVSVFLVNPLYRFLQTKMQILIEAAVLLDYIK